MYDPHPPGTVKDPIWNVLCPGPSIFGTKLGAERAHPTVAVNAAIGHQEGCDYWCIMDGPEIPWYSEYKSLVLGLKPTLWVNTEHIRQWKEWCNGELTVYCNPLTRSTVLRTPKWYLDLWFMPARSTFAAILRAIWAGGTDIRVYGCDMAGDTSYRGESGLPLDTLVDPDAWAARWELERSCMAQIIETAGNNGIRISLVRTPISLAEQG